MISRSSERIRELKRLKREPVLLLTILAMLGIMVLFVVWPLIKVLTFPNPQEYLRVLADSIWYSAALNSLFMVVISTVSCTLVAFLFSFTMVNSKE